MDDRLRKKLAEIFNIKEKEISSEQDRSTIESWDSLTQMDLVLGLEEEYKIDLTTDEIVDLDSIFKIVEMLKRKGVNFEDS